jgi:feruloyl esterase
VSRGGKLLHFHGWNDPVVTPDGSIDYLYALTQFERFRNLPKAEFDRAVDTLTPQDVAASAEPLLEKVRQYHRLFMVPGMGHCSLSGAGPRWIGGGAAEPPAALRDTDHHVVGALMKWVEQGAAPERIIASRIEDGKVVRQRPICAYPAQAAYKGSGDINDAANFTCVTPDASSRPLDDERHGPDPELAPATGHEAAESLAYSRAPGTESLLPRFHASHFDWIKQ